MLAFKLPSPFHKYRLAPLCCSHLPPSYSRKSLLQLHQPSGYFNLGDPYCHLLSTEYNSLHDPHLQAYHKRKDNLRRLEREGYITSEGNVGLDVGLIKTALSKQGSQSACCSRLLLAEGTGLRGWFPRAQKERQRPSGNAHSCSSQAALRCLSIEEAAGARPGAGARSTAWPWQRGESGPRHHGGEGVQRSSSPRAGLGLFWGRQST